MHSNLKRQTVKYKSIIKKGFELKESNNFKDLFVTVKDSKNENLIKRLTYKITGYYPNTLESVNYIKKMMKKSKFELVDKVTNKLYIKKAKNMVKLSIQ